MIITEKIKKINYENENFHIFTLSSNTRVKYEGIISFSLNLEDKFKINGSFFDDKKYGRTFIADSIELIKEDEFVDLLEIAIDGIGVKKSEEILQNCTLEELKDNPFRIFDFFLSSTSQSIFEQIKEKKFLFVQTEEEAFIKAFSKEIKGIGKKKVSNWIEDFKTWHKWDKDAFLDDINIIKYLASDTALNVFFQLQNLEKIENDYKTFKSFNISEFSIKLIFKAYKMYALDKVAQNPYILLDFFVNYLTVDNVALSYFKKDKEDYERIIQGIKYIIKLHEEEGSTFVYLEDCLLESTTLLDVDKDLIEAFLTNELSKNTEECEFILENDKLYRRVIFFTERKLGKMLYEKSICSKNSISEEINTYLESTSLSNEQRAAVINILQNKISILTGGPGTGKTTTINEVCNCLDKLKRTYVLCAPTGRAAKRITESTHRPSYTIHRLLEYKKQGLSGYFLKNEKYPLNIDTIIVDESSMVDVYILNSLMKACAARTNIIFVGDIDQLPSVSMGSILTDMKESKKIPVFTLTNVFRQSNSSTIVKNAYHIKNNEELETGNDFEFIKINNFEDINNYLDSVDDAQILCPMRVGNIGTVHINQILQNKVNPSSKQVYYNGTIFKENDLVIQTVNDYEKEVFNGETGYIKKIDKGIITVLFPQNDIEEISYNYSELYKLDLAYAITIHKSQGSETDNLIIIIDGKEEFISKELIYTAITRAKKKITFLSTYDKSFFTNLKSGNKRLTNLKEKIRV